MSIFGTSGPKIAADTLRSSATLRLIEVISEGPIKGLVTGDGQSVFFDNVPVNNADGTLNFTGSTADYRLGTVDQSPLAGFPDTEEEVDVNIKVRHAVPYVQSMNNPEYTSCRIVFNIPALQAENTKSGNIYADTISFMIEVKYNGGDWQDAGFGTINIYGKCSSTYQTMRFFGLPKNPTGDSSPWLVRVTKITADSTDTFLNPDAEVVLTNDLYIQAFVGLIERQFSYPRSALVGLFLDAQSFGTSVPTRSYEAYGRIIDVPSNYDPDARTYTGLWDGTFKQAYCNTPPWVFYDALQNNVYGLGQYIDVSQIDKYTLYQIAQYCDGMVPDGYGGQEPRFTYNRQITDAKEAISALTEIAGTFRSMPYWSSGAVTLSQDAPADPVLLVTPANVVDGNLSYTSTSLKSRHTSAIVKWQNPDLNYQDDYEVVDNTYAINRYGYRELQIDALGCTSRGQARRMGLWAIGNELANTQSLTYRAGYDHAIIMPGDIVEVQDPTLMNADFGGRLLLGSTTTRLLLDVMVTAEDITKATISVLLPDGSIGTCNVMRGYRNLSVDQSYVNTSDATTVDTASSTQRDVNDAVTVTPDSLDASASSGEYVSTDDLQELYGVVYVSPPLKMVPDANAIWVLYTPGSESTLFRVIGKREVEKHTYEINAVQHTPELYDTIDAEFMFDPTMGGGAQVVLKPPGSISFGESFYYQGGSYRQLLTISWATPTSGKPVVGYQLTVTGPQGNTTVQTVQTSSHTLYNVPVGLYSVQVQSVGVTGDLSSPASSTFTVTGWTSVPTPTVTNLGLTGSNTTEFTDSSANISWTNNIGSSPNYPVTNVVRVYDSNNNLLRTVTQVGTTYSYTLDLNKADGGPRRALTFKVTGQAPTGTEGPPASLSVTNHPPAAVSPLVQTAVGQILVSYDMNEPDIDGALVWVSADANFDPSSSPPTYDGKNNPVGLPFDNGTYRVWVALYDKLGEGGLNISSPVSVTLR